MNYSTKPVWVANAVSLQKMITDLCAHSIIAVDTESNSLFAYYEQVCLIQFSTPETDYLVDTLAIEDLSSLGSIFSNPDIENVFHAAEYDLICLKRDFGFTFTNIFDTMVGARNLGWKRTGLGNILEENFGVKVNKKYQRANWGKRPLEQAQLDYARTDTHYLIQLRHLIHDELVRMGRWDMAKEQFRQAVNVNIPEPNDPILTCWRSCRSADLNERQRTVLYEICRYREEYAQRINRPPFKVLSKEIMIRVAQECPRSIDTLQQKTNLKGRNLERHGKGLVQAVQRGLRSPIFRDQRQYNHYNETYQMNLEILREWRKNQAKTLNVESDVVMTRGTMEGIAHRNPQTMEELKKAMRQCPERFDQYGQHILYILQHNNSTR
ncbi:MAG: ribonuclease D [Anaerolineae bacterium]|jgi:ribonuclease D|nr:ribonuclease D [Anaerolineae bacterium]